MEMLTQKQVDRYTDYWEKLTGVMLEVEQISGGLFVFGSLRSCLTLRKHYEKYDETICRMGYSSNLRTWYFVLERRIPIPTTGEKQSNLVCLAECPVLTAMNKLTISSLAISN